MAAQHDFGLPKLSLKFAVVKDVNEVQRRGLLAKLLNSLNKLFGMAYAL
jgi:hypothetical protein